MVLRDIRVLLDLLALPVHQVTVDIQAPVDSLDQVPVDSLDQVLRDIRVFLVEVASQGIQALVVQLGQPVVLGQQEFQDILGPLGSALLVQAGIRDAVDIQASLDIRESLE